MKLSDKIVRKSTMAGANTSCGAVCSSFWPFAMSTPQATEPGETKPRNASAASTRMAIDTASAA